MSKIGDFLLEKLAPLIMPLIKSLLKKVFETIRKKDETLYKEVLTELYVPVDVHLETLAAKTDSKLDDAGVAALKQAIEESAAEVSLVLPNLDAD